MTYGILTDSIDRAGIEALFGVTPVPLPKLNAEVLQSRVSVENGLVQSDDALAQTWQVLSAPEAVVRVHRHGTETSADAFWVFVRAGQLVQLSDALRPSEQVRLSTLSDSAALFNEIARLLAMPAMPRKAYAHAVLDRGDVKDIFDLSQGTGFNVGVEFLVSDGLTEEQARAAFDTIRTASVAGRISFMTVDEEAVTLTCGLAIGKADTDIWMTSALPPKSKVLTLETVMAGAFHRKLVEGWSSLGLD